MYWHWFLPDRYALVSTIFDRYLSNLILDYAYGHYMSHPYPYRDMAVIDGREWPILAKEFKYKTEVRWINPGYLSFYPFHEKTAGINVIRGRDSFLADFEFFTFARDRDWGDMITRDEIGDSEFASRIHYDTDFGSSYFRGLMKKVLDEKCKQ